MMMKYVKFVTIVGLFSCLTSLAHANNANIFDSVNDSSWGVDVESPTFGVGDMAKFTCKAPMHINASKEDMRWKAGQADDAKWTAKVISEWKGEGENIGLVIQYDQEARLDLWGNPIVWLFVMPDKDHFYWTLYNKKTGATFGKTRLRFRCKPEYS
ncbi:MAG: hypothetical protein JKY25_05275 [Robiginitomaculum sp.]|nr:hypothetical protein [Robiginitomaculum sp.]